MPGLRTQLIDIPLSGGLSDAVDRKLVQPGSFLRLENVEHLKQGGIVKRKGYGYLPDPGQTIERVVSRGQELVGFSAGNGSTEVPHAKIYSPSIGAWAAERKGDSWGIGVSRRTVSRNNRGASGAYCLPIGQRVVWIYWTSNNTLRFRVEDLEGEVIASERELTNTAVSGAYFRACVTSNFAVVVLKSTGGSLSLITLDPLTLIVTQTALTLPSTPNTLRFDVCAVEGASGVIAVAWEDGSSPNARLRVCTVNALTAVVITASSGAGVNQPNGVNVLWPHIVSNGPNLIVSYSHEVTAPSAARNVRLARWSGVTALGLFSTASLFDKIVHTSLTTTISFTNYGSCLVPDQSAADGYFVGTVMGGLVIGRVDDAGDPIGFGLRYDQCYLVAAPFAEGGRTFWPITTSNGLNTLVGPAVFSGAVLAINPAALDLQQTSGAYSPDRGSAHVAATFMHETISGGFLNLFSLLSTGPLLRPTKTGSSWRLPITSQVGPVPGLDVVDSLTGIDEVSFDVSGMGHGVGIYAQGCGLLVGAGGVTSFFDGTTWGETGFLQRPILTHTTTNVTAGTGLPKGKYTYAAHYEWPDDEGNVHSSEPFFYGVDTTGVAGITDVNVNLAIRAASLTQRPGVTLAVYRTLNNQGRPFFRLTPRSSVGGGQVLNSPSFGSSYTDSTKDADAESLGLGFLYTDGGIRPTVAPPPSRFVVRHRNRIWLISSDDPNEIWFSKLLVKGEPPSFGRGLSIRIDGLPGPPVALASLDDKLLVFTATSVHYIVGEGPADTGTNGSFSEAYDVSTDCGCVDPRSVVSAPFGCFFLGPRGLMLISGSLEVSFAGAAVEATTTSYPLCRRAELDAGTGRVVWLMSKRELDDTRYVIFDYDAASWYVHLIKPLATQRDHCTWRNAHVVNDGRPAMQGFGNTPGRDPDSTYVPMLVETPEFNLGVMGGFRRLRNIIITGERLHPHTLRVELFNDYASSTKGPDQNRTFDLSSSSTMAGLPNFQAQLHVKAQKASSARIRITDDAATGTTDLVSRTGPSLSGLTLELGVIPGPTKLSPSNKR